MKMDLMPGTLDMMVLKALTWGPLHGYDIMQWLEQTTDAALQVEEGSLYPALHRMEKRRWVRSRWGLSDNNRHAKYYRLTAAGRRQLEQQASSWQAFTAVVGKVLAAATPS